MKKLIFTLIVLSSFLITGCDVIMNLINPTPSEEPRLTGTLFFDDFEDGPDPAWRPTPGSTWMVKNGRYTISENSPKDLPMQTFIGSPSWQDYSVEMDVYEGGSLNQVAVLLRVQDEGDMVGFFVAAGRPGAIGYYAGFRIRKDGIWRNVGSWWDVSPVERGIRNFNLLISVEGNTYSASVNAELITTVEISDAPARGYVGLQTAYWGNPMNVTAFDNFQVISR